MRIFALLLVAFCSVAFAQDPTASYGLKGELIGETLQDLRSHIHPLCSGDSSAAVEPAPTRPNATMQEILSGSEAYAAYVRAVGPAQFLLDSEAKVFHGDKLCQADVGIAGSEGRVYYRLRNERLTSIFGNYARNRYLFVKNAVDSKYGHPSSTRSNQYRNESGATYEGETASWVRPDSEIELNEVHVGGVDEGDFEIFDPVQQKLDTSEALKKTAADF